MVDSWAIIQSDLVVNTVVWDGDTEVWRPPAGQTAEAIPDGLLVTIGWSWNGTTFVEPYNPTLDQPGSAPDVIQ